MQGHLQGRAAEYNEWYIHGLILISRSRLREDPGLTLSHIPVELLPCFPRTPLALNQHPCMWALKEPCGWCALCAWPLHPARGTWLQHLPVEKGLLYTVFFSQAASALSVALNFSDTPEASAKEARARATDTLPPL